jgi:hypothetical protein
MVVTSELRTHKVMEAAIRELMGAGTPPRFKFQDTYASIEFPDGYTVPAQATLEAKYNELLALEEDIQKTAIEGDLEVGTSNIFVDIATTRVGIGTDEPGYTLDVRGTSNVGALTATSVDASGVVNGGSLYTNDKIYHNDDTNTNIGFPANDTFTVNTNNVERLRIDSSGNMYGKGLVLNTYQFIDSTSRSTTSGGLQAGYTTPWCSMRAKSKFMLDVHIPWRNDGSDWGGSYHVIYMMVNKAVGTVAANTWVLLSNSGYYMTNTADILSYKNTYYVPLTVNEDFQVRFFHQYRVYNNGTLYINGAHWVERYTDSNLLQLGISANTGYSNYIIEEIGG